MKNSPGAMNRIYRLVWNDSTGAFVAVAETSRARGKRSTAVSGFVLTAGLVSGLLGAGSAWAADPPVRAANPVDLVKLAAPAANALPQGGQLVSGQASWQNPSTSQLNITQSSSKAAINWQSFDIGAQAQVKISQPNAQSVLLNRVIGADPSAIYGRLDANGQVLLVNPNGIVFGKGSRVDVGGLVASTLDIQDADFTAGHMKFSRNGASGSVLNQGQLTASAGGYVALLAPHVINEGVVSAQLGTVALAAGDAVTLDLAGSELLGVKVDPATVAALVENRELIQAEGGRVLLSAGAAQRLRQQAVAGASGADALVDDGGTLRLVNSSGSIQAQGGAVRLEGATVGQSGQVNTSAQAGGQAGTITISADHLSQGGVLDASSAQGAGGRIHVEAGTVIQTASAQWLADGAASGGQIRLTADQRLYSSATFSARSGNGLGGDIALSAASLQLRAGLLDASGATGGGRIRVGGGFQGNDADLPNAQDLGVNGTTVLRADATRQGHGGQVILWSDGATVYGGHLSAKGAGPGGNGGLAEVSGKGDLTYAGTAELSAPQGAAGKLLLDPRNIIIDNAGNSLAALNLDDPTASTTSGFGTATQVLGNGNVVITAPNTHTGATLNTGAVYLFNSSTGALLSDLHGTNAGDHVGSAGIKLLGNGSYLVMSPKYGTVTGVNVFSTATADSNAVPGASAYAILQNTSASAGAITWQSASGSGSNLVGSGNSVVGSTANTDSVTRYTYSGSTINNAGAITITANDRVGNLTTYDLYGTVVNAGTTTLTELSDGHVLIATPNWNNGRGAVTWLNTSTGQLGNGSAGGAISSATAVVGSTPIRSRAEVSADNAKQIYVLGLDLTLPYTYTQGSTNRRTAPPGGGGDAVGQSLTVLPGGGYVISSPQWTNGSTAYAGAVTHGAAGGSVGAVSASNSLVGSHAYDFVGSGGVTVVGGGNYVVSSPYWSDSGNAAAGRYLLNNPNGAATWVATGTGQVFGTGSAGATVDSSNSLTGNAGALLGSRDSSGISPTTAYDYNLSFQLTTVTSSRTQASGTGGITLLKNGNYLVVANAWDGNKGSVTFGAGAIGVAGVVSASNSLVGTAAGDSSSNSIVELSGSNYLVVSPYSDLGAVDGGAVTWGSGSSGVSGAVGTGNSLYGSQHSARVGSGGVLPVGAADGQGLRPNAIVLSPQWGNRSAATSIVSYGAVTWLAGATGFAVGESAIGASVSIGNSLVGSHAGDYVGSIHTADQRATLSPDNSGLSKITGAWDAVLTGSVNVLANGDYVVRSPSWDGGKGAITWAAGGSGVAGAVSASNSLVGSVSDVITPSVATPTRAGLSITETTYYLTTTGDHVGLLGMGLSNGNYVAISPYWSTGRGAVTVVGAGNATGVISASNSLVGSTPDVYSDANHSSLTSVGDRLGTLGNTTWVVPVIGENVRGPDTYTSSSIRPVGPYSFATTNNVQTSVGYTPGGANQFVGRSYGTVAPRNLALRYEPGYLTADFTYNGTPILKELDNGNVLVASPGWNNGSATQAGAITWFNGSTGALTGGAAGGVLSAANSLVGDHSGDVLGYRLPIDGVTQLSNGNFALINPQWHDERGAVTWGSGTAGVAGTVSSANSLVGSVGSGSIGFAPLSSTVSRVITVGTALYLNSDWLDRSSDGAGDRVGLGGVTALADGNAAVSSPFWTTTSAWTQFAQPGSLGAVTWINGSNGQLKTGAAGGLISAANSLVGSQAGDAVGYSVWTDGYNSDRHYLITGGVTALAGGAYAVASPWWSNGATAEVGAVTFNPAGGLAGAVSSANSLVGGTAYDHVGRTLSGYDQYSFGPKVYAGVVVLDTGSAINYAVRSVDWTNPHAVSGSGAGAGAVTWVDGSNGHAYGESSPGAVVGASNSLVGSAAGDAVGQQFIALSRNVNGTQVASGDLLILSNLEYCGEAGAGAITLLSGGVGAAGPISWRNSVIGLASASAGMNTTTYDAGYADYLTDVQATLLPTAVTGAEQVAYRPFVWASPNATSGSNATKALVLTNIADNTASPVTTDQVNGSGGNANWVGSRYVGDTAGFNSIGASSGLLAFSASTGSDVVITPTALTALLNAGTEVTLQASNDITVLRNITSSAAGAGGNLILEAGRSIYLRADINTDGGNFFAHANQDNVVNGDCGICTAVIHQQAGTRISTGTGHAEFVIAESGSKPYNDAGAITLASVDALQVRVINQGADINGLGQGIRFQPGAVVGRSDTESLTLRARGSSANPGGGVVLANDTQLVGGPFAPIYLIAGRADLPMSVGGTGALGGADLAVTATELGRIIRQSSGYNIILLGAGDQQLTTVGALDFTQSHMQRGSSGSLDVALNFQTGMGGQGGVNIVAPVNLGSPTGDARLEFNAWDGIIQLASGSSITAGTGRVQFNLLGSTASVTQASGTSISAGELALGGSGTVTLTAGTNTIGQVFGQMGSLDLKAAGSTTVGNSNGGLSLQTGGTLQASGAAADLTLANIISTGSGELVLAAGRHFHNPVGSSGIDAGSGRYLVYSTNPASTTEGLSGYDKHYAQTFTHGATPSYAGSGNWFLYSVSPTLTVSAGSGSTVTYGSSASTPTVGISGFIDGDNAANATSGALNSSLSSYTPSSAGFIPAGSYTLTLSGQGTFTSALGYTINVTPGTSTLTVQPKLLDLAGLSAASKVYDGTNAIAMTGTASLSGGGASANDGKVINGDGVNLSGTATGSFGSPGAGVGKTVTIGGLSLSGTDAGNYSLNPGSVTADITPKALTLSGLLADASKVYDGNTTAVLSGSASLLAAGTPGGGSTSDGAPYTGDTVNLTGTATGTYNSASVAGAHTVGFGGLTLTGAQAANYTLDPGSQAATITPKSLNVTGLTGQDKVYDATNTASLAGTAGLGGVVGMDAVSLAGTALASFGAPGVGSGKTVSVSGLSLSGAAAGNYTLSAFSTQASITPRTLNVSAIDASKVYGDADPTLAYSIGGLGLVGGDSAASVFGGALSTATGANATAGTHAITQGSLAISNGNYQLGSYTPGTLSVSKAVLNLTANNAGKTYGDTDPTLGYTVNTSQLKYTDTASVVSGVSLSTATGAAATAGTHAISLSGGTASNYDIVGTDGTLSVSKATLNLTANNAGKTYGDADPTLGYSVNTSQLKYSDTAGVVSGVALSTATGAAATAGTHAITASGGTAANYDIVSGNGTLTVAKATLNVSAADASKVYGDADPTLGFSVNTSQLKYSDTAGVVSGLQLSTVTGAAATAGTHAITASGGAAANYDIVSSNGTLTVGKAQLQLTAADASKVYGDADPALGFSVNTSQLKYSDTAGVVSGVQLSTATGAAATAGTHAITASGGTAANYDIVSGNGTLTVGKATLQLTAADASKVYGDADPTLGFSLNTSQLKYADTAGVVSGVQLSTATGAAATAGTHAITASGGTAANYTLVTSNGTLTVGKATLQLTAADASKVYGDADPTLGFSLNTSQLKYADTANVVSGLTLGTVTGAAATAGTHAITASGGTAANYTLVTSNGTLTVDKALLNVSANNAGKTYGDADPTLGYSVNAGQLKYADTARVVSGVGLSTVTGAAATAGTHAITASGGTAANYTVVTRNGTLTVDKATLNLTAANASKTYGDADPTLAYTVNTSQLKYADTAGVVSGVALSTATGANATAGTHAITASGGTAANYNVVAANGMLTVGKATLNVSALDAGKVYGAADPTLGFSVNTSQLKYADTASVVNGLTLTTATGAAATAGTHAITASGGTAANYNLVTSNATLTVAKAPLTVRADDKGRASGEPDPTLTYSVAADQLKYTDTASVVSGVNLSAPTGAGVPPGSYAIAASGGTAANYALQYVDGTLVVTPSPSIKAENLANQIVPPAALPSVITLPQLPSVSAPPPAQGQPGSLVVVGGGVSGGLGSVGSGLSGSGSSGGSAGGLQLLPGGSLEAIPAAAGVGAGTGTGTGTGTGGATGTTGPAGTVGTGTPGSTGTSTPAPAELRLIAIQPQREVRLAPATAFQLDTSASFEKPPQAKVDYTARLADGRPLPSWLTMDAATGVLSGTPPAGESANVDLVVTAQIEGGASASTRLNLRPGR